VLNFVIGLISPLSNASFIDGQPAGSTPITFVSGEIYEKYDVNPAQMPPPPIGTNI